MLRILATSSTTATWISYVVFVIVAVFELAAWWKIFTKAGHAGWGAIIPLWNLYVLCKIAKRPGWWLILLVIPLLNILFFLIISIDLARQFSKGTGFGVGLWLLSLVFAPILGFGSAVYLEEHGRHARTG